MKKPNVKAQRIKQQKARKRNISNKRNKGAKAQALQERKDRLVKQKKAILEAFLEKVNEEFNTRNVEKKES